MSMMGKPSRGVHRRRSTTGSICSLMNETWPSQNAMLHPVPWKLKNSSLTPQLLTVQGHQEGPPKGSLELLMTWKVSPNAVPSAMDPPRPPMPPPMVALMSCCCVLGGPDTPLAVSGSAQRQALRYRLPDGNRSMPPGTEMTS